MKKILSLMIVLSMILTSCSVEPQPITYGSDACHYCKMNIVDNQYATELVTKKGKVYKYDAMECMLNEMKEMDSEEIAFYLTNTFDKPGELVEAEKAIYLISENMPSPMGANLSAFKDKNIAKKNKRKRW